MARELTFSIGGREFYAEPSKVDRSKLYGSIDKLALDDDGVECQLVYMDESGTIIIPKGGTALSMFTADGKRVERDQLKTVRLDGSPAELTQSSYVQVNSLERKATAEELLDCAIKAFYHLSASPDLIAAIGTDIYVFDYCFRDSYETSPAFLLVSEQQDLFMLTGTPNEFSYIGLEEVSVVTNEDETDEDSDDDGDIDFAMF
jgi:hypothetical protein